jgi:hypothetical protein
VKSPSCQLQIRRRQNGHFTFGRKTRHRGIIRISAFYGAATRWKTLPIIADNAGRILCSPRWTKWDSRRRSLAYALSDTGFDLPPKNSATLN